MTNAASDTVQAVSETLISGLASYHIEDYPIPRNQYRLFIIHPAHGSRVWICVEADEVMVQEIRGGNGPRVHFDLHDPDCFEDLAAHLSNLGVTLSLPL